MSANDQRERAIEVELRAEVSLIQLGSLIANLNRLGNLASKTKRLSVMFYGQPSETVIDIRVRITNGEVEVVFKRGELHVHDRVEVSQPIQRDQFLGFARLFALLSFKAEVAERETDNFALPDGMTVSVVRAGPIAYVEAEIMAAPAEVEQSRQRLLRLMADLQLKVIETAGEFNALCDRLSQEVDWPFDGSQASLDRLAGRLEQY